MNTCTIAAISAGSCSSHAISEKVKKGLTRVISFDYYGYSFFDNQLIKCVVK